MSEEGSAPTDVAENSTHQAKPTWNSARAPTGYPDPDDQQHAYGKLVAFSHFNYGQDKSMFVTFQTALPFYRSWTELNCTTTRSNQVTKCWRLFGDANYSREPAAVLSAQGRTVRGLVRGGGALWSGADGPRHRAGRSATWCRSLGSLPDGRTVRAYAGAAGDRRRRLDLAPRRDPVGE
jgi:hypothetical protein